MSDPNLNHLAARIALEECVRRGCRTVVVCPGSRSAPLAAAAAAWRGRMPASGGRAVDVLVAHDERGAAFLALGAARVTGHAAVVITTSGTAVANLLPAAVEASMDSIPMLLFTADRPPELHGCGANQSVPQSGMLAPVVRAAIDMRCPDDPGATPLEALDAVACAWERAHGTGGAAGPVHVNWRFREPLAPVVQPWSATASVEARLSAWQRSGSPWRPDGETPEPGAMARRDTAGADRAVDGGTPPDARLPWRAATGDEIDALCVRLRGAARGVLVVGGARSPDESAGLARIARALQWPAIADIASGLRTVDALPTVVHHADLVLCARAARGAAHHSPESVDGALHPDMILRIGGRIASKRVQQWIDDSVAAGCALAVAGDGIEPMDPSRMAGVRVRTGAAAIADRLSALPEVAGSEASDAWLRADAAVARTLERACGVDATQVSEPGVARAALREAHRADAMVMLSSSMPVRDADMHADRTSTPRCVANRGASGIDGIVATAAGACRASGRPVLLLIGDVAALHDLASWSLLRDLPAPMCVVVVNNDGGGIFRFLPIAEHPAIYSPWFDSPHGLTFEGAARMFALEHVHAEALPDCIDAMRRALRGGGGRGGARHAAHVVEVRVSADRIIPDHRAIQSECISAVREALLPRVAHAHGGGR